MIVRSRLPFCLAGLGVMLVGCDFLYGIAGSSKIAQPERTPAAIATGPTGMSSPPPAGLCPEAMLSDPPTGMEEPKRVIVALDGYPTGLRVTWSDPSGREFTILSGIEGEVGGPEILAPVNVRGQVATVSAIRASVSRASDTYIAKWREAPQDSPCGQYAAIATGFSEVEFRNFVDSIR